MPSSSAGSSRTALIKAKHLTKRGGQVMALINHTAV